jgi:hypothetical protein
MRVLSCEMTEEQKQEFCKIHNLDRLLLEDNCPCPKVDGIAIFPKQENVESLQQTVSQLTAHLALMTEQLNNITMSLKK